MIYHFYMQQTTRTGAVVSNTLKDLEEDFPGLHYLSCKGIETIGKPKNIYTENYAEADGARVFHPSDVEAAVAHEVTQIELELLFEASSYRTSYRDFCNYLNANRVFFWDTARLKKMWLTLEEAIEPDEDIIKGIEMIKVTIKFNNNWGIAKPCNSSGVLL